MSIHDRLLDAGYEDVVIFVGATYDSAFLGVTEDNRAVYNFDLMVDWLIRTNGWTQEDAIEWIDYNVIRALPYRGDRAPIIVYSV